MVSGDFRSCLRNWIWKKKQDKIKAYVCSINGVVYHTPVVFHFLLILNLNLNSSISR